MKKGLLIFCSLFLMGFLSLNAQKVWSLEECINYAWENNLLIKRQGLNVRYNKNNYTQSYFSTLPNLNGNLSHGYSSGKYTYQGELFDDNAWNGDASLSSSLTLFNGLQTINKIRQNKYLYLQSQSDLKKQENDVALSLANAYLQVLFAKELVGVSQNKLQVTSMQVQRTQKLLEVGNVAQGEFLQIKAQEASDKTSLINARNTLEISFLDLTQLLDLDSTGGFEIVIPANIEVSLLSPLPSVQEIFAIAIEGMPQIKSAEFRLKSSEKQLSVARGAVSPNINVSGGLTSQYYKNVNSIAPTAAYGDQLNDNLRKYLFFGVQIPIFNQLQVRNSISNAKLNLDDSKLQLDIAKMALYKEVQQAHADASAAREKYNSSVEAVNYNEEAFKYTSQKMEVGLVNSVDYNIAQNNLISAQSSMLQAKYEYIFMLKILDLYMGKQITL